MVEVQVHSRIKPDLHRVGEIPLDGTMDRMSRQAAVLGGAIAEGMCSDYEDTLDPSEIAKLSAEAFRECWARVHGK